MNSSPVGPFAFPSYALAAGRQDHDAVRVAGWRSQQMISRHAACTADGRAHEAHKRMARGDRL